MAKDRTIPLYEPADGCTVPLLNGACRDLLAGRAMPDGQTPLDSPLETRFRFRAGEGAVLHLRDEDGQEHELPCPTGEAGVYFLKTAARYEWYVTQGAAKSAVHSFLTEDAPFRWIRVPGVSNVRDVGGRTARDGVRLKQGLLFRSSEWNAHKAIEEEGIKILLEQLRLRTEIDLRGMYDDAWPALDTRLLDWRQFSVDGYARMLQGSSALHARRLFACLARRETYPACMHCWGGMDRTATATALVLALCGVPYGEIERDYVASSLSPGGVRTPEYEGYQSLKALLVRYPGDEERSAREALRGVGVTDGEMDAIRRIIRDGA